MDPVTLNDVPAPDSVLDRQQLRRIDRAEGNRIPGIAPNREVGVGFFEFEPGLTGPQLATLMAAVKALFGVYDFQPVIRMKARAAADMPPGQAIDVSVEATWEYPDP